MSEPWKIYNQVIVETYSAIKGGKFSRIHVRPVDGQKYETTIDVECSRTMRKMHPVELPTLLVNNLTLTYYREFLITF